jgi:Ser/Thr protein kinase RdoA (MazF antagonist)
MDEPDLRRLLATEWGIDPDSVAPLSGGMNSETWDVQHGHWRYVAKTVVERNARGFEAGLRAACVVDAGGIPAGRPVPTGGGAASVAVPGGRTALLRWVPGRPLSVTGGDVARMGTTLARVHTLLSDTDILGAPLFAWLDPSAPHLDVEPWVRPAVTRVHREWLHVRGQLRTWGVLHGDPAPEAFVESHRGCGLIDWASTSHGPLLFDVASAVMYVGPEAQDDFLAAYLSESLMSRVEAEALLPALLRVRWAVQASYFALRVREHDLTGIDDHSGNARGLADARRNLEECAR